MNRQEFLELLKQKTTYNQIYDVINEANYIVFHGYAEGYWSGAVQEEDIVLLLDDFLQLESDIISQIIDMKEYYIGELDGKHSEVMGDVTIFLYKSCKEFNPKSPDILDSYIGDLVEEKWFSECVSKAYRQYKNEKSILQQNKLKARWSKKEDDILIDYPKGKLTKCDANYLLAYVFNDEFVKDMTARRYDMTTLNFSIEVDKNGDRYQEKFPTLAKYS